MSLSNSEITVDAEELQAILDELTDKQKSITEATGALRSKLQEILDDSGWHKGALATIRKIDAMSETARADFLRTFAPMFAAMMEYGWEAEMQDMLDGAEDGGEGA